MEKNIRNLRIGDILKEYGYVSDAQIGEAIAYQKEHKGVRIGGALIALDASARTSFCKRWDSVWICRSLTCRIWRYRSSGTEIPGPGREYEMLALR